MDSNTKFGLRGTAISKNQNNKPEKLSSINNPSQVLDSEKKRNPIPQKKSTTIRPKKQIKTSMKSKIAKRLPEERNPLETVQAMIETKELILVDRVLTSKNSNLNNDPAEENLDIYGEDDDNISITVSIY